MSTPERTAGRRRRRTAPAARMIGFEREVVCVQGLGFVGTAMALATATARRPDGTPAYDVIGVELDSEIGRERASAINAGRLPIASADSRMQAALETALETGNLVATTNPRVYAGASVAIVDIGLDLVQDDGRPSVDFTNMRSAVRSLARTMPAGSLIIVESTVPPGTCETVIGPEIAATLAQRGLAPDAIMLAHAYERVMPGADYLDSIVNFWRVFAGSTPEAADACERFLSDIVNVERYPLTRLGSTTASETGKVLENSYRAVTIAFMEEWGRFAEMAGIDLFEVISAIRTRPTHSNMRQPGFGVGGYCLTKDPLFADYGARELLGLDGLEFPFSRRAVEVNNVMPLVTLDKLEELLGGLAGRRILLLGVSYRQDVDDTRSSPSALFVTTARARGAEIVAHDPFVEKWSAQPVARDLPIPRAFDAVVFAVPHTQYQRMDVAGWLGDARPLVIDANKVLEVGMLRDLLELGCRVWSIGRGQVES